MAGLLACFPSLRDRTYMAYAVAVEVGVSPLTASAPGTAQGTAQQMGR